MTKKRRASAPLRSLHAFFAIASAGLLILTVAGSRLTASQTSHLGVDTIVVDHAAPLELTLRGTAGRAPGVVDISHTAATGVLLHVPEQWTIREVRNARIADVPFSVPENGSRGVLIPAGSIVSFIAPQSGGLRMHNLSGNPLFVRAVRVQILDGTATENSMLITTKPATLW